MAEMKEIAKKNKSDKAGLAREVANKQKNKFDELKFKQICDWINSILGTELTSGNPEHFGEQFCDGKILCRLMAAIHPDLIDLKKAGLKKKLALPSIYMDRIKLYNDALKKLKLNYCEITPNDLATQRDLTASLGYIHIFGMECYKKAKLWPKAKGGIKSKANKGSKIKGI